MSWTRVCSTDDIADAGLKDVEIAGTRILVTRSGDEFFAYPLRCPHLDEPLSTGMCDGETLTCSFHLWQWNLRTGKSTGEAEIDLLKYPVRVIGKDVEIDFSRVLEYD